VRQYTSLPAHVLDLQLAVLLPLVTCHALAQRSELSSSCV
jgi:hypothetical protein